MGEINVRVYNTDSDNKFSDFSIENSSVLNEFDDFINNVNNFTDSVLNNFTGDVLNQSQLDNIQDCLDFSDSNKQTSLLENPYVNNGDFSNSVTDCVQTVNTEKKEVVNNLENKYETQSFLQDICDFILILNVLIFKFYLRCLYALYSNLDIILLSIITLLII